MWWSAAFLLPAAVASPQSRIRSEKIEKNDKLHGCLGESDSRAANNTTLGGMIFGVVVRLAIYNAENSSYSANWVRSMQLLA
jgi:hypothetical protein